MTYSRAKVQGQWSIGSEDRVETNGRTDGQTNGGDRITSLANAVGNQVTFGEVTDKYVTSFLTFSVHAECISRPMY